MGNGGPERDDNFCEARLPRLSAAEIKVELGSPVAPTISVDGRGECGSRGMLTMGTQGMGWTVGVERTPAWAIANAVPSRCSEPNAAEVTAGAACRLRALPTPPAEPPVPGPGSWSIPIGCQNVLAER